MKKNYRSLSLLLAAGMLAGALAGCGGAATSPTMTDMPEYATAPSSSPSAAKESDAEYPQTAAGPECNSAVSAPEPKGIFDIFSSSGSNNTNSSTYSYQTDEYPDITVVPEYNTESYDKPDENGFFLTQGQPFSTFAADVDTASYANIRRMIESGYLPSEISPEAVRPEEFINYFSYDLSGPRNGEKFGVTTEVATCPWNDEHQLMFVGVKAEDKLDGEIPESNLVFLIDVSGSMDSRDKLPLLQKAFKDFVDNLPDKDKSAKSLIEQGIIDDAKTDAEELAEMDRINASGKGVTINMGHTGLSLRTDKPAALTNASTDTQKAFYEKWEIPFAPWDKTEDFPHPPVPARTLKLGGGARHNGRPLPPRPIPLPPSPPWGGACRTTSKGALLTPLCAPPTPLPLFFKKKCIKSV